MPLLNRTRLGPYEIVALIGVGGMVEVFRATDTLLGRTVAIKVLNGLHSERFRQEARAIAALNHPHICQIYDVGPDYLVLEHVEGETLADVIAGLQAVPAERPRVKDGDSAFAGEASPRGMELPVVLTIARQITSALEAAHAKGILHRDLKPANIMIVGNRGSGPLTAKLVDFGLATAPDPEAEMTRTQPAIIFGTTAYMSPEQIEGRPLDARSDVFSFGAILYEMVAGARAFRGPSTISVLNAILREPPPALQVPSTLQRLVDRGLAKAPERRFQTLGELRAELERPIAALDEEVRAPPATTAGRPSIAVLPFENMSPDKRIDYFSEGLTEEIINILSQIKGLRVVGRVSSSYFRGKDVEFAEIGRRLHVDHILEGSVRKSGNRIRVTGQLINVRDGFHLWSDRF